MERGGVPFEVRNEGDFGEILGLGFFEAWFVLDAHVVLEFLHVEVAVFLVVRFNNEFPGKKKEAICVSPFVMAAVLFFREKVQSR